MKYFQNRNRNAVAVVATVLETTCRTHLLWTIINAESSSLQKFYVCEQRGKTGFKISK